MSEQLPPSSPTHIPGWMLAVAGVLVVIGLALLALAAYTTLAGRDGAAEETSIAVVSPTPTTDFFNFPTRTPVPTLAPPTTTPLPPTSTREAQPTATPTNSQTPAPPAQPTTRPLDQPTTRPTDQPTTRPTDQPTTQPPDTRGVQFNAFNVENPAAGANQDVWFNFSVTNATDGPISYGLLGVRSWLTSGANGPIQGSWTAETLSAHQTLEWRDHINFPNPGTYNLRLSMCFSSKNDCLQGLGDWVYLSPDTVVQIN